MAPKQNKAEKKSLSLPKKVWRIVRKHGDKESELSGGNPNYSAAAAKLIVAGDKELSK